METVTPFEQIEPMLLRMQEFCNAKYDTGDIEAVVRRSETLEIIMSKSGKLCADAKYHKDKRTNDAIMETLKESLLQGGYSPSLINKKVDALCMDYNYIEKWADRVNRTATHQLDFSRSTISKYKSEINLR
jgi:hypothetical protein